MPDYAAMRQTMVDTQLRPSNITNAAVLHAFATVPREIFVSGANQPTTYSDDCIKLEDHGFMLPPALLGQLVQALNLKTGDHVLAIGCNTGYTAAVLGYLSKQVVTLTDTSDKALKSENHLSHCRICNVQVVHGPLEHGWIQQSPYDAILIEGAVPEIPEVLIKQLADQGRIVAILQHEKNKLGTVCLFQRLGSNINKQQLFKLSCPTLQAFSTPHKFCFT